MSRAAFVSSCGDPYTLLLLFQLFQKYWRDEVDRLYIDINNHCGVPPEAIAELIAVLMKDPKVHVIYHPVGIGNGVPITEMTLMSKEDYVLLLEDDGFIFTSGKVDEYFKKVESGEVDVCGSERFSCGVEVGEASQKKYGLDYSGYGDRGPNYWPNFFFCKRADLLRTDLDFGSHAWKAGEYCPKLDHTFKGDNFGDTFVWACVQLRALGLRFLNIPQFHADPYEVEHKESKEMNWVDGDPFWIHGGSLSSGWGGYLTGGTPDVSHESAKLEMETRCAFWRICAENPLAIEFCHKYRKGIDDLIKRAELSEERIIQKGSIYRGLIKPWLMP